MCIRDRPYVIERYNFEAWRHWNIVDAHLATQSHMVGNSYSLVDMALWGWARAAHLVLGDDAMAKLPNVKRLLDEIHARPAAQRVDALKAQFNFKTEMDAQACKAFSRTWPEPKAAKAIWSAAPLAQAAWVAKFGEPGLIQQSVRIKCTMRTTC